MKVDRVSSVRSSIATLVGLTLTVLVGAAHAQAPGDLDPSFAGTGKLLFDPADHTTSASNFAEGGLAIQADGKIVVATSSTDANGDFQFVVSRFHPDGTADTSFDGDGMVAMQLGDPALSFVSSRVFGLTIQADQKIVASGNVTGGVAGWIAVMRLNPDGSLDGTFGIGGVSRFEGSDPASPGSMTRGAAMQPDGKILLGCDCKDASGNAVFGAVRLNPDGSLDTGFGTGGIVRTQASDPLSPNQFTRPFGGIALAPDGKIVVAGCARPPNGLDCRVAVARYNPDGTLDPTFAIGGVLLMAPSVAADPHDDAGADAMVIQPDGKILIGAQTDTLPPAAGHTEFAVIRLNLDGSFDTSFGTDGIAYFEAGATVDTDSCIEGLALQADGKIIAIGEAEDALGDDAFAIARLNTDGSLDTSFGVGGVIQVQASDPLSTFQSSEAEGVAIQADGKIVAYGDAYTAIQFHRGIGLVRVLDRAQCDPPTSTPSGTAIENGSGVNCVCYTAVNSAVLGTTWQSTVTAQGPADMTLVIGYTMPGAFILVAGELLVNPMSSKIATDLLPWHPLGTTHSVPIPNDMALQGRMGYFQGGTITAGTLSMLCNSVVVTLQ